MTYSTLDALCLAAKRDANSKSSQLKRVSSRRSRRRTGDHKASLSRKIDQDSVEAEIVGTRPFKGKTRQVSSTVTFSPPTPPDKLYLSAPCLTRPPPSDPRTCRTRDQELLLDTSLRHEIAPDKCSRRVQRARCRAAERQMQPYCDCPVHQLPSRNQNSTGRTIGHGIDRAKTGAGPSQRTTCDRDKRCREPVTPSRCLSL